MYEGRICLFAFFSARLIISDFYESKQIIGIIYSELALNLFHV